MRSPTDTDTRTLPHRVTGASAAIVCAVLMAACGGAAAGGTTTGGTGPAAPVRFADCMRSHGVPSFPDPSTGRRAAVVPGPGLDPRSPAFQAAQKACGGFAPRAGAPSSGPTAAQRRAAVAFAACMRTHGQPTFPDPVVAGSAPTEPMLFVRGMMFPIGPSINPRSPGFQRAAADCGLKQLP